jgi:hypothetical protein
MATELNANYTRLTLTELAKRTNDGGILDVAENLSKTRAALRDGVWVKANKITSHVHTRRIAIPAGTWRIANKGVAEEASRTRQVEESVGTLEAFSVVDEFLIDLAQDKARFVLSEDVAFLEGLAQTFATCLVYGKTATDPEQFDGWAPRAASLGTYVLSGGGSTSCTSVYLIQWGETKCHFVFMPGIGPTPSTDSPVERKPLGFETVLDGSSNPYRAHRTQFKLHAGFCIHDDRNFCAHRNIATSGGANLFNPDKMVALLNLMENMGEGAYIYCNRTVMTQVDIQAMDKANVMYGPVDVFGEHVTGFRGHPLRLEEAILNTETAIT